MKIINMKIIGIFVILAIFPFTSFALTGGPDDFGYVFYDSNEENMPEFSWIDLCESKNSTNFKLANDAVSAAVPIGFSFNFYGKSYSYIYVSANGFISFDPDAPHGCCNGEPIPDDDSVNNMIAGLWDDLSPSA